MKTDMRIILTKRLLHEGMLRMLAEQTISKISITDLCKESGVNRATFYKHYESPVMILREIAWDYATQMRTIYETSPKNTREERDIAMASCLRFLYERKAEVRLLFSKNAENCISGFGLEVVNDFLAKNKDLLRAKFGSNEDDYYLYAILTSSAAYGLLQIWLVEDIRKTPEEIVAVLRNTFGENLL